MALKTNKSYTKRLKATKSGKLVARTPGRNHFNAKMGGEEAQQHKRTQRIELSNKKRGRYMPYDC